MEDYRIIKDRAEFKLYTEELIGQYSRNAVDYYSWSEPDSYPCIACSHVAESNDSYPTIFHNFLYLNDRLINRMTNYQITQDKIIEMDKDELAIYLVDPDEIIRTMAKKRYEEF